MRIWTYVYAHAYMHISKRFRPSRGDSENNMKDVFETNENADEIASGMEIVYFFFNKRTLIFIYM